MPRPWFGKGRAAHPPPAATIAAMNQHLHPNDAPHEPDDGDELLDAAQACEQEFQGRVQPKTLAGWRTARRAQPLPFIAVGRRRLYRRRDIRGFIAA